MESTSLRQFFAAFRHCLRTVFNYQHLFLMLKNEDLGIIFRKKELGVTHTLNIDDGKCFATYKLIEKYEGVLPDNKKDFTQGFSGFTPEFSRRDLVSGGFLRNNIICWPVHIKSQVVNNKGADEVLMMIQMNGGKNSATKYNAIDMALMNIMAKIAAGALLKIKAERLTVESMKKSHNMFDTFRQLLSERNHAVLN